jgi:hypothetical protein
MSDDDPHAKPHHPQPGVHRGGAGAWGAWLPWWIDKRHTIKHAGRVPEVVTSNG